MNDTMTPDEIAHAVRSERLNLSAYLAELTDAQWAARSLCTAWTVREVAAHLTVTTRATLPSVIVSAIKARGSFDRMTANVACERAARFTPTEIVEQLRESAESSRRIVGSGPMDPLMDVLIHGQDIAIPLQRPHPMGADVALAALRYVAPNRMLGGPRRVGGLTLVATDAHWSTGDGPTVQGTAENLLLVSAGRSAALPHLSGPGLDELTARLAA